MESIVPMQLLNFCIVQSLSMTDLLDSMPLSTLISSKCYARLLIFIFIFAGVPPEDFVEDLEFWRSALRNYWSLLTPLIFSDHPKRPGDEDPLPPFNMIRNVMDMNAHYGGLNAAFLEAKRSVWVMNVVPTRTQNTLPFILYQGFAGVLHDW